MKHKTRNNPEFGQLKSEAIASLFVFIKMY